MNTAMAFVSKLGPDMAARTYEHILLVFYALTVAIAIALPLGIYLTRCRWRQLASGILNALGVIQTIPSLALIALILVVFAFADKHVPLIQVQSIGFWPALVALVLYALLPIVRNTYTGIRQVDERTVEVARGMGMTSRQVLMQVELPLALPVIMAGIRIATVWTIGVACLTTLVGGGGLGDLIMIGLNRMKTDFILGGTIPAALLAIVFDHALSWTETWLSPEQTGEGSRLSAQGKLTVIVGGIVAVAIGLTLANPKTYTFFSSKARPGHERVLAAFDAEFLDRPDGYPGLKTHYGFEFRQSPVQMDPGLMYKAVADGTVDVVCAFATDGRIPAYDLYVLEDDKGFFPPYYAAPLVREETLNAHPEIRNVLNQLGGRIDDQTMQDLNFQADEHGRKAEKIAREWLEKEGLIEKDSQPGTGGAGTVYIGGKNFTEQEILAHMMALLIEHKTGLSAETKTNLGGTMVCFQALTAGDLDIYAEYTGTGLVTILKEEVIADPDKAYDRVSKAFKDKYGLVWLEPFGLNNTYTLAMRKEQADRLGIETISDLAAYVDPDFEREPGGGN